MALEIGTTYITAGGPPPIKLPGGVGDGSGFLIDRFSDPVLTNDPRLRLIQLRNNTLKQMTATEDEINRNYQKNLESLDAALDESIKAEGGLNLPMGVDTPKESIAKEIDILERLQQANQEAAAYESQRSMSSGDSDILNSKAVFNTVRSKYGVPKEVLVAWAVNYEAARQAQVYAEAARRLRDKINALASALAALEAAEQQAVRAANTYRSRGSMSAAGPLLVTPAGTVAVVDGAAITLQAAIRSAITALAGIAASVGAGAAVGVSALFYSSKLANGELPARYALSVPLCRSGGAGCSGRCRRRGRLVLSP